LNCSSTKVVPSAYRQAFSQRLRPTAIGVWSWSFGTLWRMPECHRIRRMGKWYGCSTRQYRVATWCETVGRQNRGGDDQGHRGRRNSIAGVVRSRNGPDLSAADCWRGSLTPRTWEQGGPGRDVVRSLFLLEVAAGLEPAKTGFADQRLGHFGIATSKPLYPRYTQTVPKLPPQRLFTPILVPATY
jgi:hypothetical protein